MTRPEDRLAEAFEALGIPLQPGLDTTAEGTYAVYAYDTNSALHGDDTACLEDRAWSLVFVAPLGVDQRAVREQIRGTIRDLFGVLPSEEDVTGGAGGQQYLYEFETILMGGEPLG